MGEDRYIIHLTESELTELMVKSFRIALNEIKQEEAQAVIPIAKYVYGLKGLADLLGCSKTTAWTIKDSGKIDKAIRQVGRKIITDTELALKLLGK